MTPELEGALAQIEESIESGAIPQPAFYYQLERACLAALPASNGASKVALFVAAKLADDIARRFDDEAIPASEFSYWAEAARRLSGIVRLNVADDTNVILSLSEQIAFINGPTPTPKN